jgi:hypothetical protein
MGIAELPSGKRVRLPKKMSVIWLLLSDSIELFADTTATTSALTALMPRQTVTATLAKPIRCKRRTGGFFRERL